MTAANKAILASTTKKTVRALLYKRLSLVKFTAFGAFYNCIEKQYEKDHPGQIISFYHFHQIEENWKVLLLMFCFVISSFLSSLASIVCCCYCLIFFFFGWEGVFYLISSTLNVSTFLYHNRVSPTSPRKNTEH